MIKRGCYVIISRNNKYATMRSFKYTDGRLGFLGGKVEPQETHAQAAAREAFEEGGVRVKNLVAFRQVNVVDPNKPDVTYDGVGFRGTIDDSEELVSSPEGEVFWGTREQILANPAFPDLGQVFVDYDLSIALERHEIVQFLMRAESSDDTAKAYAEAHKHIHECADVLLYVARNSTGSFNETQRARALFSIASERKSELEEKLIRAIRSMCCEEDENIQVLAVAACKHLSNAGKDNVAEMIKGLNSQKKPRLKRVVNMFSARV